MYYYTVVYYLQHGRLRPGKETSKKMYQNYGTLKFTSTSEVVSLRRVGLILYLGIVHKIFGNIFEIMPFKIVIF